MRKKFRIAAAMLLVSLVGGIWFESNRLREPVFEGKRLSQWLEDFGYGSDSPSIEETQRNENAAEAVRQIGTNALPHLLGMIRRGDSPLRDKCSRWANKLPFVGHHFTTTSIQRQRGLRGLKALGPTASPIMAELTALLDDKNNEKAELAAFALSGLGPQAIPSLLRALTNHSKDVRLSAVHAFRSFGTNSTIAVPALIQALNEPDANIRSHIVFTLGVIGEQPNLVVPALIKSLKDPDYGTRLNAAAELAKFGADGRMAVPALTEALLDSHPWVRNAAAEALATLDPNASGASVTALIADLQAADDFSRQQAAETIGKLGELSRRAIPALLGALADGSNSIPYVPYAAITALDKISPEALERGIVIISTNLGNPDAVIRRNSAATLGHLELKAAPALPALIAALQDENGFVRNAAAEAITRVSPDATPYVVPQLTRNLNSEDSRIRSDAASLLGSCGHRASQAVPELLRCLEDINPTVRIDAAAALKRVDPQAAASAIPILVRQLTQGSVETRRSVVRALAEFGELAKPAVPALLEAIRSTDQEFRNEAAYALKRIDAEVAAKEGLR